MKNFWKELPQPFFVLAPMEDVTDFAFREIMATILPSPNVFFTEFVSADGLNSKGKQALIQKFSFSKNQHPIVAQIWGTNPENILKAARLAMELNFNGIDINMGCPVLTVTKRGGGAGLIKNPTLAAEIIQAAKEGAKTLPISVKTRLGFEKIDTENWIGFLLKQKIAAITVHGRVAKEMSKFPANWDEIQKAVIIRNKIAPDTIFIGNGDVKNTDEGRKTHKKYGVDGLMIARGILHNPWAFDTAVKIHTQNEYLEVLEKHLDLYEKTYGEKKNYAFMKKFFKMYIKDFEGANETRIRLMETKNISEARIIIKTSYL